jgi:LuxR family maltose regulon positive regulatory protein
VNGRPHRPALHGASPESLLRAEESLPAPPRDALRRPYVEQALDRALRSGPVGMVLLRGPRGAGRRTAVTLWSRELVRNGRVVIWVDVPEPDAQDGDLLAQAVSARLASVTGTEPSAPGATGRPTAEALAAALDAHGVVLVVDRIGPASGAALACLDRLSRLLSHARIVALTAMPLPGPVPGFDGWAHDREAGSVPSSTPPAVREPTGPVELTLRDLAVRADEARAASAARGVPLSGSQAHLLVTAAAGWAPVVYPALDDIRRASSAGSPVTDDVVSTIAAAHRARFLRATLPEEAISVLVEVSLAPRFSRSDLESTGLLTALPGARTFIDRLVATGLVLDDPAVPDDVLAMEPSARRALLDFARGRDRDELRLRATRAARRRERAGDARGALLAALESGDAALVRDLLQSMWTSILDGQEPTLHEAVWSAATSVPTAHVPAELRVLLAVTRRSPGRPGAQEPTTERLQGSGQPNGPEGALPTFARIARLRRTGRTEDALRLARALLNGTGGGSVVGRVLVGLQAAVTATEAGLLHEALRYAEAAHHGALGSGALPLATAAAEVAALVHALDSNVHAAADWSAEADVLPEPPSWWRRAVGYPSALASALTHIERFDDELSDHLAGAVRDAAGTDLWFAGLHVEAMLAVLRQQEELAVGHLRDALSRRGRTPAYTEPSNDHLWIPPLLTLDLGRLYLMLGSGTNAMIVADAPTSRASAAALLDGLLHLAQRQPHDALLAVGAVGHEGATAGARLTAHLVAAEALSALDGPDAGVRRELAHAAALAQQVGGALPYWWASSDVLRLLARDAPPRVCEQISQVLHRRAEPVPAEFVIVPDRQLIVLHRLADGMTSTEVAKASFVSHNTVKTQIREVYRRLGVHDRTAALRRARELGLLDPMVRARLSLRS